MVSVQRDGIVYGPETTTNVASIKQENGKLYIHYESGRTMKYRYGIDAYLSAA